jgi:hypothetical protein
MNFIDYTWDEVEGTFVKENILGSEFSFTTRTNMEVSIDYIPKIQARKIFTYAKEQLDILKVGSVLNATIIMDEVPVVPIEEVEIIEEMETEEVTSFAEIMSVSQPNLIAEHQEFEEILVTSKDKSLSDLSQDELFEKLQNYKKLLDNGLILQGEYDAFKKEILSYM